MSMYTCAASSTHAFGSGSSPELDWGSPGNTASTVPSGTMYFAITFLDITLSPDGVMGTPSMGDHWAIYNIPSGVTQFPEGATATLPSSYMGATQVSPEMGGKFLPPCATMQNNGTMGDEYQFTVYALKSKLTVSGSGVEAVVQALQAAQTAGDVLATASIHAYAGQNGS